MDQSNSIRHMQRAQQILSVQATKRDREKAYRHIHRALTRASPTLPAFGTLEKQPEEIVKMIASALGSGDQEKGSPARAEKIYQLMATNHALNSALKPFVIPQRFMKSGPNFYANAQTSRNSYDYYCKDKLPWYDGFVTKVRFVYNVYQKRDGLLPDDDDPVIGHMDRTFVCDVHVDTKVQDVLDQLKLGQVPYESPNTRVDVYHSKIIFPKNTQGVKTLLWKHYKNNPVERTAKVTDVMRTVCDNPIVFHRRYLDKDGSIYNRNKAVEVSMQQQSNTDSDSEDN